MLRANSEALKRPFRYDKHCIDLSKEEIDKKIAEGVPYVIRQKIQLLDQLLSMMKYMEIFP